MEIFVETSHSYQLAMMYLHRGIGVAVILFFCGVIYLTAKTIFKAESLSKLYKFCFILGVWIALLSAFTYVLAGSSTKFSIPYVTQATQSQFKAEALKYYAITPNDSDSDKTLDNYVTYQMLHPSVAYDDNPDLSGIRSTGKVFNARFSNGTVQQCYLEGKHETANKYEVSLYCENPQTFEWSQVSVNH